MATCGSAQTEGVSIAFGRQVHLVRRATGLSNPSVASLYEDLEGSLWVGTASAASISSAGEVRHNHRSEGLPADVVWSVREAADRLAPDRHEQRFLALKDGVMSSLSAPRVFLRMWFARCSKTGTAVSGSGRPMASTTTTRKAHRVSNVVLRTVARHDPTRWRRTARGTSGSAPEEVGSSARSCGVSQRATASRGARRSTKPPPDRVALPEIATERG